AGLLIQVPDAFLRAEVPFALPPKGEYAVGLCFLPRDAALARESASEVERILTEEGLHILGWREVAINDASVGATARRVMPSFRHLFIQDPAGATGIELDRKVFVARKRIEHE